MFKVSGNILLRALQSSGTYIDNITSVVEFLQPFSLSRYSTLFVMQITQPLTRHLYNECLCLSVSAYFVTYKKKE